MAELRPWGSAGYVGGPDAKRVVKLGRDEQEASIAVARLKQLGDVGALEVKAQFAQLLAESAQAEHQLAQLVRSNGWLVSSQAPPKRWTVYLLTSSIVLLLGLQIVMFARSQLPPFPAPDIAPKAGEGSKVVHERKGRVAP